VKSRAIGTRGIALSTRSVTLTLEEIINAMKASHRFVARYLPHQEYTNACASSAVSAFSDG